MNHERSEFEEKSEKILRLLRRKDNQIGILTERINQLESNQQIKCLKCLQFDAMLRDLRRALEEEEMMHAQCRADLKSARNQIDDLRGSLRLSSRSEQQAEIVSQAATENEQLRQIISDQDNQIQVLVSEIARLRETSFRPEHISMKESDYKDKAQFFEISLKQLQEKYDNLSAERERDKLEQHGDVNVPISSLPYQLKYSDHSFEREHSSVFDLYRERIETAEVEIARLSDALLRSQQAERDLQDRLMHQSFAPVRQEIESELTSNLELIKAEIEMLKLQADAKGSSSQPVSHQTLQSELDADHAAHIWWSYVWSESKRLDSFNSAKTTENESCMDLTEKIQSQAVELVMLRQKILAQELAYRKRQDNLQHELDLARKENTRQSSIIRQISGDEDIKISRLKSTIKALSSRSDFHSEIVKIAQDLEAEKLTVHHLRSDIISYKSIIDYQQSQLETLNKELSDLREKVATGTILTTVSNVPGGVSASKIIELMGGKIISLQREVDSKCRLSSEENSFPKHEVRDCGDAGAGGVPVTMTQLIFESANSFALNRTIELKDKIIFDLKMECSELQSRILSTENDCASQVEKVLSEKQFELMNSLQRQKLLQAALNDSRCEIEVLRQKLSEPYGGTECGLRAEVKNKFRVSSPDLDTIAVDNQVQQESLEILELRQSLREKASLLKILTDTMETLQLSGERKDHAVALSDLGGDSTIHTTAPNSVWVTEAMVKRVVELSTELSRQVTSAGIEELKNSKLEVEKRALFSELFTAKKLIKKLDDENIKLSAECSMLFEQVKYNQITHAEVIRTMQADVDKLMEVARESDMKVLEQEIAIEELKKLVKRNNLEFKNWVESQIFHKFQVQLDSVSGLETVMEHGIGLNKVVEEFFSSWKESVRSIPVEKASFDLDKIDQSFTQKVVELLNLAMDRAIQAESEKNKLEARNSRGDFEFNVCSSRLNRCIEQLRLFQSRAEIAEHYVQNFNAEQSLNSNSLITYLRQKLSEQSLVIRQLATQLSNQRNERNRSLVEMERLKNNLRRLSVRNLELESAGTATVLANEQALLNVDSKLKLMEKSFHTWIGVEVPRMLTGLPIHESDLVGLFGSHNLSQIERDFELSIGIDKTLALTHAVTVFKAVQTLQDAKISKLSEMNSLLSEKYLICCSSIDKWKSEILLESCNSTIETLDDQKFELDLLSVNDSVRLITEKNIDLEGKLRLSCLQVDCLKSIVAAKSEEDEKWRIDVLEDMNRQRIDLENAHSIQLQSVFESHDKEKAQWERKLESLFTASGLQQQQYFDQDNQDIGINSCESVGLNDVARSSCDSSSDSLHTSRASSDHDNSFSSRKQSSDQIPRMNQTEWSELNEQLQQEISKNKLLETELLELEDLMEVQRSTIEAQLKDLRAYELNRIQYESEQTHPNSKSNPLEFAVTYLHQLNELHDSHPQVESARSLIGNLMTALRRFSQGHSDSIDSAKSSEQNYKSSTDNTAREQLPKKLKSSEEGVQEGRVQSHSIFGQDSSPKHQHDELEMCQKHLMFLKFAHETEMKVLREHFDVCKKSHEGAIHALESQAADIRSSNASTDASSLDGSIQALVYDSILVAEEKLKALERIFQSRHSDFEEAMRAMVTSFHSQKLEEDVERNLDRDREVSINFNQSVVEVDISRELLETRLKAAEREIDNLNELLRDQIERNATLNQRVSSHNVSSQTSFEIASSQGPVLSDKCIQCVISPVTEMELKHCIETQTDEVESEVDGGRHNFQNLLHQAESCIHTLSNEFELTEPVSREKIRGVMKRANEVRSFTRSLVIKLSDALKSRDADKKDQIIEKLKIAVADFRHQIGSLREENNRKSRLLVSLREAKSVDSNSLEQWKRECNDKENLNRRLQRSLMAKDSLIKDLRARLESVQSLGKAEVDLAVETTEANSGDSRNRVRSAEMDLSRIRASANAWKEKASAVEEELQRALEDVKSLNGLKDEKEALQLTLSRKTEALKTMKERNEKLKVEISEQRTAFDLRIAESEKKIRFLQRQVDGLQRNLGESTQESALMRKRLEDTLAFRKLSDKAGISSTVSEPVKDSNIFKVGSSEEEELSANFAGHDSSCSTMEDLTELMIALGGRDLRAELSSNKLKLLPKKSSSFDSESIDPSVGSNSIEMRLKSLVSAALGSPRKSSL